MHACLEHLSDLDQGAAWRQARQGDDLGILPLHAAVLAADFAWVQELLGADASVNQPMHYGFTPLHLAARGFSVAAQSYQRLDNWTRIICALLDSGADAAARDWQGRLPMALAEGWAPLRLRMDTKQAAERGAFYDAADARGPGKRASGDIMERTSGDWAARKRARAFA